VAARPLLLLLGILKADAFQPLSAELAASFTQFGSNYW